MKQGAAHVRQSPQALVTCQSRLDMKQGAAGVLLAPKCVFCPEKVEEVFLFTECPVLCVLKMSAPSLPLPQGMLALLSKCIDRMNLYNSAAHFAELAGEEAGVAWKDILNLLYELLGQCISTISHPHLLSTWGDMQC